MVAVANQYGPEHLIISMDVHSASPNGLKTRDRLSLENGRRNRLVTMPREPTILANRRVGGLFLGVSLDSLLKR